MDLRGQFNDEVILDDR